MNLVVAQQIVEACIPVEVEYWVRKEDIWHWFSFSMACLDALVEVVYDGVVLAVFLGAF
jgi:hypothetical protein